MSEQTNQVVLRLDKTTKNTYRYRTQQKGAVVNTVYIEQEHPVVEDAPETIRVTVERV